MSDRVIPEENSDGVVNGYRCDLLTQGNSFDPVSRPYYYDLTAPCGEISEAKQMLESLMLDSVATQFRMLPDAQSCTDPPRTNSMEPWMAAVRTEVPSDFVASLDCATPTTTEGECCRVVKGQLEISTVGGYNVEVVRDHVKSALNESWLTSGTTYTTFYRGAEVEYTPESGRDDPPIVTSVQNQPRSAEKDGNITLVGGFLVAGIVAIICGALFTFYRVRRRKNSVPENLALAKSLDEFDTQSCDLPTLAVDVVSEASPPSRELHSFNSSQPASYRFDLGESMRADVMDRFGDPSSQAPSWGPTSIAVVPPYAMEETSDSEADSWAQTEGTVGSLETRLEVIEAEI